jgi:hypothetical protein
MDNLTREQALRQAEAQGGKSWAGMTDADFNPLKNPEMITIEKQQDGNFKLRAQKHGKMIELRGVKPEDVLVEYLTSG